jgi:dCMP deaminase
MVEREGHMDNHEYYMNIAIAVRKRANCMGRKVGAVLVKQNRIISTGYNGTPEGFTNCVDGGCVRCRDREKYKASAGYDVCVCVHAEQNALLAAARFGNAVEDSVIYSTMQPCFDCTKSALQARVSAVYYLWEWQPSVEDLRDQYNLIQEGFLGGIRQVKIYDPEGDWANGKTAALVNQLKG